MPPSHLKHHQMRMALGIGAATGNWYFYDKLIVAELDKATEAVAKAEEAESVGEAEVSGSLGRN